MKFESCDKVIVLRGITEKKIMRGHGERVIGK